MKKTTKLQAAADREEAKPRQHGPQKEKTQITIRVDSNLINEAYAQMKEDNTRITDILERGLVLALYERNRQMPIWDKQVRFMVANATKEQQGRIRGLLFAMAEPLVRKDKQPPQPVIDGLQRKQPVYLSHQNEREKIYELVCWFLDSCNKQADLEKPILEYYSRYGKSAEEIAELQSL